MGPRAPHRRRRLSCCELAWLPHVLLASPLVLLSTFPSSSAAHVLVRTSTTVGMKRGHCAHQLHVTARMRVSGHGPVSRSSRAASSSGQRDRSFESSRGRSCGMRGTEPVQTHAELVIVEQAKLLRDLKYGDETDELEKADGKEEAQGHEEKDKDVDESQGRQMRERIRREEDDDLDKVDLAQVELESRKHMQLALHEKSFALTDAQSKPTKSKPKRKQEEQALAWF